MNSCKQYSQYLPIFYSRFLWIWKLPLLCQTPQIGRHLTCDLGMDKTWGRKEKLSRRHNPPQGLPMVVGGLGCGELGRRGRVAGAPEAPSRPEGCRKGSMHFHDASIFCPRTKSLSINFFYFDVVQLLLLYMDPIVAGEICTRCIQYILFEIIKSMVYKKKWMQEPTRSEKN